MEPEPLEALPEELEELEALPELLEQPEEPKPKRGPGRPRKTQELLEPQSEEPKRGPGRPRKTELPAQEPKRGPGRPRKTQEELKTEELKTPLKTPPRERGPKRREEPGWEERQLDPIAELTRLIKQRNEEQARQRKTTYANMLGL